MLEYPILVFALGLISLWFSVYAGAFVARRSGKLDDDERADLGVIVTAALTLLGLIIGFTFSMAVTRFNQRKDLEAAEANAIGTEMLRAELLPSGDAARVRQLLRTYLEQRVSFYTTRDEVRIQQIKMSIGRMQTDLWSALLDYSTSKPTPLALLVVSGMNDVFNTQAYTQASWWNRIPTAAWVLMGAIATFCGCLLGYTSRKPQGEARRALAFSLIVATSFFLIADIDSPRGGAIRVSPRNLETLYSSTGGS